MASRTRKSRPGKATAGPSSPGSSLVRTLRFAILAIILSAQSVVNTRSLSPVYGGIPASLYHSQLVTAAFLTGTASRIFLFRFDRREEASMTRLAPVVSFWIPVVHHVIFRWSADLGANYGPLFTESITIFPIFVLLNLCTPSCVFVEGYLQNQKARAITGCIVLYIAHLFGQKLMLLVLARAPDSSPFYTRIILQYILAILAAIIYPSKKLLLATPALLHGLLLNPHVLSGYQTTTVNRQLNDAAEFALLARSESTTGYISVLENMKDRYRVMRCDHSLLGGEWLHMQATFGDVVIREPIYLVFAILEAVRLVEIADQSRANNGQTRETALVIGLGVGTSVSSLIAHGVNTTVVEIDPVVYRYAEEFFALHKAHNAYIGNALDFVEEYHGKEQYDYIIHDVFTGGAEPGELFTAEFLGGLKRMLKKDGAIAINFAGNLALTSAQMTLRSILSVFPSCRFFREDERQAKDQSEQDFTNLIVFCIKQNGTFGFRDPTDADFLGSGARQWALPPKYEEKAEDLLRRSDDPDSGDLLTRRTLHKLENEQKKSAIEHWKIMRSVLPNVVWEMW